MTIIELDYMEYANDAAAQAAYVSSDAGAYSADLIPTMTSATAPSGVASADSDSGSYYAWQAFDADTGTIWEVPSNPPHWLKYDFGSGNAKVIQKYRMYVPIPVYGSKTWQFQGSNNDSDWDTLDTQTDINWASGEWKDFTFSNSTAYRYYRLYITASNGAYLQVFELEMMEYITHTQCYSESTIKQEGSYSLKGVAAITDSLNDTLTRTVDPTIDLSDVDKLVFDIYSSRTGSNIKIGIHDSGGTTTEITPNILSAGEWQEVEIDISGVSNANKDVIDSIIITIVNADAENTFYIDNFKTAVETIEVAKDVTSVLSKYSISGQVTLSGSPVEGATVRVINSTDESYVNDTLTDAGGNYKIYSLSSGKKYHVVVEYETGGQKYNATSKWAIDPHAN